VPTYSHVPLDYLGVTDMAITLNALPPLKHGGDLPKTLSHRSNGDWLDMSTGISPWSWPIPELNQELWHKLPASNHQLINQAADYYQANNMGICVTPGSQLAIRLIPQLLAPAKVALPTIGYQEHKQSWQLAGHEVIDYQSIAQLLNLANTTTIEHAVVINPNNPTGEIAQPCQLQKISTALNGHLVVDEAFIDCVEAAHTSVSMISQHPKIITLRSLGKFFGLAGARIGFVVTNPSITQQLKALFEPWSISGPSLFIAEKALADHSWQCRQRERIAQQAMLFTPSLRVLADRYSITESTHSGLFHTLWGAQQAIDNCHQDLATAGIWTRRYNSGDQRYWLRFSLPHDLNLFTVRTQALNPN